MTPHAARIFLSSQPSDARSLEKVIAALQKSPELLADYERQLQTDHIVGETISGLPIPPLCQEELAGIREHAAATKAKARFHPLDPAMLSVTVGFLLLVGLLTWHFLGRAGVFPEEALSIAVEGVKLRTDQFEIVAEEAGVLEDWFLMKGFERFRVPSQFAKFQTAGARIFKIEGQQVGVLAIPENFMFFMVFDPAPLGIEVQPEGSWRVTEFDYKYAAAIREQDGMCFMVVVRGTKADLEDLIAAKLKG